MFYLQNLVLQYVFLEYYFKYKNKYFNSLRNSHVNRKSFRTCRAFLTLGNVLNRQEKSKGIYRFL